METNKNGFILDPSLGYFRNHGVDVMAFDDIYPAGHQSGVSILMHGNRVATNGDIRFEQTPGQWQPTPKQLSRELREEENVIVTALQYPDMDGHLKNFNPRIYPDFCFNYQVTVKGEQDEVRVTVDLSEPVPPEFAGKLCFNLELFPGALFGRPYLMDGKSGIFPRQPNGPTLTQKSNFPYTTKLPAPEGRANRLRLAGRSGSGVFADGDDGYDPIIADDIIAAPYAAGHRFTVRPEDPYHCFTVESEGVELKLYDGRMNHNNGWFVLSSEVPENVTEKAVEWIIRPTVVPDWVYKPVVQVSQVGYHPMMQKQAFIELDRNDARRETAELYRITESGRREAIARKPKEWGQFLRYNYLVFDFSDCKEEGLYQVAYGDSESDIFRIAEDVFERGVWQPVLEYFLPVQMCHMRVNEKYKVWHGLCHNDDARMAPVSYEHIDGYIQGPSTLTKYRPGDAVPGLNSGGWHDAGDFDLRVESQSGESYILSLCYEEFGVDYDATSIDQKRKVVEIHEPDGRNDIQQQIEHGLLTVVGGYRALGRLYRGIIASDLRQYVLLGDAAAMTDNIPGNDDDRWVFTEDSQAKELQTAAHLAASSRALRGFNDSLSEEALKIAETLFETTVLPAPSDDPDRPAWLKSMGEAAKLQAAMELFIATGAEKYRAYILGQTDFIRENISRVGWIAARAVSALDDPDFREALRGAMEQINEECIRLSQETPYGIPYRPRIWGAGWDIQRLGFQYYFLQKAYPGIFEPGFVFRALNFVLGCHPGSNTASFASGVGTRSATVAYGLNRADWTYIPGGVISGTALIRPDFPELLEFPFLWQQTEYVLGGGSSNYMFLVLAARKLLGL